MPDIAPHPTVCGFENPPGAQYCGVCGRPLAVTCGRCGTEVPAGFSFCTSCGNPLAGSASHHPRPTDVGGDAPADGFASRQIAEVAPDAVASERRLVSVLFCDLEDSTGLAESLDPEEVRDILQKARENKLEHEQLLRRVESLRSPVASMSRLTSELVQTGLTSAQRELVEGITAALTRIDAIASEVLPQKPRS